MGKAINKVSKSATWLYSLPKRVKVKPWVALSDMINKRKIIMNSNVPS